jgi:hypothetical protein
VRSSQSDLDVTRFTESDRTVEYAPGVNWNNDQEKTFKVYTVLEPDFTSNIPNIIRLQAAVVLWLVLSSAASGLFFKKCLNLKLPPEPVQGE